MSDTRIDEIGDGIYRLSTPVVAAGGAFSFNQYLLVDDAPLLFHTGPKRLFASIRAAFARVMAPAKLRYVAFSHFESDECGSTNAWLELARGAVPLCGTVNTLINADAWERAPRTLADGEALVTGRRRFRWLDAPHLPHAWECGYLVEETSRTLLCGDLFTQPGTGAVALTTSDDILEASEAFRKSGLDYFSHTKSTLPLMEKLAATAPTTLACMHGSAFQGDGAALLRALGHALDVA